MASNKTKILQAAILYCAMVGGLGLSFCVSMLTTKILGPKAYGEYKVIFFLFSLSTTLTNFGFFYSSARLLITNKDPRARGELLGASFLITLAISVMLYVFFICLLHPIEATYGRDVRNYVFILLPLIVIFPAQACLENVLQGDNKILLLSSFRLTPSALYFISLVVAKKYFSLSLLSIATMQFSITFVVLLTISILLRPRFANFKSSFSRIKDENKRYGLHVYTGAIFNVASVQMGALLLGYFVNSTSVGYFSLAVTIASPLIMIPNSIGTSFFQSFASQSKIPSRIFAMTIIISLVSLAFFMGAIDIVFSHFFPPAYSPVISLTRIIALGAIFHGVGDFINRFLGAHGKGLVLRNCTMVVGIVNVAGYIILGKLFGAMGATVTMLIADSLYFLLLFSYYIRFVAASRILPELHAGSDVCDVEQ